MSNMSYCRFENTLTDLKDCQEALQEGNNDDISDYEKVAMKQLIDICKEIARDFDDE